MPYKIPDEIAERIKELWAEGMTGADIARIIGNGMTRCSILGKVHRMGLQPRKDAPTRVYAPRSPKPPKPPKEKPAPPVSEPVTPLGIGIMALGSETCRYPYGDQDFTFCGHAPKAGRPYCEAHCSIAYVPPKEKANDRAAR